MRTWLLISALLMAAFLAPSIVHAQRNECACLHNETNKNIHFKFRYKDENNTVRNAQLSPTASRALCWSEGLFGVAGSRSEVLVEMDVDMTDNMFNRTFPLPLVTASQNTCDGTPSSNHFAIRFEPANINLITIVSRTPAYGPGAPAAPYYPPGSPQSYPPAAAPAPYYPPGTYPPAAGGYPQGSYPPGPYPPATAQPYPAQPYPQQPAPYYPQQPAPYYPPGTAPQQQAYPAQPAQPAPYYPPR